MFARAMRGWVVAVACVFAAAMPAAAHTDVVSSKPADGQAVAELPSKVRLTFGEPLIDGGYRLALTTPAGEKQELKASVAGPVLSAPIPDGGDPGKYVVAYRAVASDGHPLQGSVSFRLKAPKASEAPTETVEVVPASDSQQGPNLVLPALLVLVLAAAGFIFWRSRAD